MTDPDLTHDLASVIAALDAADRVLVASHENPDGDAIGSLAACKAALTQLGKERRLYLHQDSPLPHDRGFLGWGGPGRRFDPASLEGWTLLAGDCGNERRIGPDHAQIRAGASVVVDIDHDHEN